ncbi:MAG: NAD(P)-dependent oxidoreductase [Planctomycetaceae bacterium]|nr:NAD(P)-dependent oxidoreductase [Planctomycetaceae bacterium]
MRTLVIGGAGYIGSALCRHLLERGHDVTVLDLLLFGREPLAALGGSEQFRLVQGDLRDESLLMRIVPGHDALVLLAAIVGEPACNRNPDLAVDTNLHGAIKVLNAARSSGVSRFVFSSTCSNYGAADPGQLVTEEAPLQPISTYSETKVAAERAVLKSVAEGFVPTVLRFSTAFGIAPRMRFDLMVSDFTLAAVRDRKIVVFGEQFWRPFVHVEDISRAVCGVLDADPAMVSGNVFNVGGNEANVRKIDLAECVQRLVPGTQLEYVKRDTDPRSYRVDFSKIRRQLGFQPEWTIDDGIRELHQALIAGVWPDPSARQYCN